MMRRRLHAYVALAWLRLKNDNNAARLILHAPSNTGFFDCLMLIAAGFRIGVAADARPDLSNVVAQKDYLLLRRLSPVTRRCRRPKPDTTLTTSKTAIAFALLSD